MGHPDGAFIFTLKAGKREARTLIVLMPWCTAWRCHTLIRHRNSEIWGYSLAQMMRSLMFRLRSASHHYPKLLHGSARCDPRLSDLARNHPMLLQIAKAWLRPYDGESWRAQGDSNV